MKKTKGKRKRSNPYFHELRERQSRSDKFEINHNEIQQSFLKIKKKAGKF